MSAEQQQRIAERIDRQRRRRETRQRIGEKVAKVAVLATLPAVLAASGFGVANGGFGAEAKAAHGTPGGYWFSVERHPARDQIRVYGCPAEDDCRASFRVDREGRPVWVLRRVHP